jgi:hypothetical protein
MYIGNHLVLQIKEKDMMSNSMRTVALAIGLLPFAVAYGGDTVANTTPRQEEGSGSITSPEAPKNDSLRARVITLYGPSGLITAPNAYVVTPGRVTLGTFFGNDKSFSGNYGVIPGLEIGASYLDRTDGKAKTLANAKFNIVPANWKNVEFGVGVVDAVDAVQRTYYFMGSFEYLPSEMLTKNGIIGARAHVGVGDGIYKKNVIAGTELLFSPRLSAIVEYASRDVNYGLRYVGTEGVRFGVGIQANHLYVNLTTAFNF